MSKETNIHKKMFLLQQEIGAISKDANNPFYKSKYFDINSLIKQLNPLLEKHKILLSQPTRGRKVFTILKCIESETSDMAWLKIPKSITDPQKKLACITYFRRGTLTSLLGLQAEDDDGNTASGVTTQKPFLNKNTPLYNTIIDKIKAGTPLSTVKSHYNAKKDVWDELAKL